MIRLDRVDSTNAWLRERARDGAVHGTAVLAREQTAGRGRLGRSWLAAPGEAVLLSVLIREDLPAATAPLLALGAAVAAAEAVPGLGIKWPNDLLAPDGRKVAGILVEAEFAGGRVDHAVVGIGLNLRGAPALPEAAALDQALPGHGFGVDDLAEALAARIVAVAGDLRVDAGAVLARWRARSVTLGRRVAVGDAVGIALDLDPDGALVVGTPEGPRRVRAGDLGFPAT